MFMQKLPMAQKWVASAPGTTTVAFGDVFAGEIEIAGVRAEPLGEVGWIDQPESRVPTWLRVLSWTAGTAGTALGAYHGYKRHDSVGAGIGWGILGGLFWPISIPVAFAQGFGKRKTR